MAEEPSFRTVILKSGSSADSERALLRVKALDCLIPQYTEAWASASYKAPLLMLKEHLFVELF